MTNGFNFYERPINAYSLSFVVVPITIRTAPVVQLSLNLAPVTVDEFFEKIWFLIFLYLE